MGSKADNTKRLIKDKAYELFTVHGYKEVTMKAICESTGLSRGGLYRYYGSTQVIFEEIVEELVNKAQDELEEKLSLELDAKVILEETLSELYEEMLDNRHSLSLAIYEYSNEVDGRFFEALNEKAKKRWQSLINYGIQTKAFKDVDVDRIVDTILYAYQGVKMWSKVIRLKEETAMHIIEMIREILIEDK